MGLFGWETYLDKTIHDSNLKKCRVFHFSPHPNGHQVKHLSIFMVLKQVGVLEKRGRWWNGENPDEIMDLREEKAYRIPMGSSSSVWNRGRMEESSSQCHGGHLGAHGGGFHGRIHVCRRQEKKNYSTLSSSKLWVEHSNPQARMHQLVLTNYVSFWGISVFMSQMGPLVLINP